MALDFVQVNELVTTLETAVATSFFVLIRHVILQGYLRQESLVTDYTFILWHIVVGVHVFL